MIGQSSKLPLNWLRIYLWRQFCQESGSDFVYVYRIINKCTWHTRRLWYWNEGKIFELSIARWVRWFLVFVDLKVSLLIAGPINTCKYFPVARIIACIIFKFRFVSIHMLEQTMRGFAGMVTCYWDIALYVRITQYCWISFRSFAYM